MTREEFDERVNKTLVSLGVRDIKMDDEEFVERWSKLFEFYQHLPEEAMEVILMDVIDEHRRGDGAMYN